MSDKRFKAQKKRDDGSGVKSRAWQKQKSPTVRMNADSGDEAAPSKKRTNKPPCGVLCCQML